jgi:hypothetical protein
MGTTVHYELHKRRKATQADYRKTGDVISAMSHPEHGEQGETLCECLWNINRNAL